MTDKPIRDERGRKIGSLRSDDRGNATVSDASGRKIGTISVDANGNQTALDSMNRRLGTYEQRMNVTRNARGFRIGNGNTLMNFFFTTQGSSNTSASNRVNMPIHDKEIKDRMNRRLGVMKADSQGNFTVYDAMNRRLGMIKKDGNDKHRAFDAMNRCLGVYDARMNVTQDARGIRIGNGDLLSSFYFAQANR